VRIAATLVLIGLLSACDGDNVESPADFPVQFAVVNNLIAPVSVQVDGAPLLGLLGGTSASLTVSSKSQWVTWTSSKPLDDAGVQIPDDIGEITQSVGGINGTLSITNVIKDQTYFTARIFNDAHVSVSIGLFDGATLTCVSRLPASGAYTQTGYYRLLDATELRAYRDPVNCTGPYVSWSGTALRNFEAKSGALRLSLATAP